MLPSFCRETVTVKRAGTTEKRGTTVRDWDNATTAEVGGCSVQPGATSRDYNGRELQVTQQWTLYAPPGSDIQAGDRIEWGGLVFEVDGAPMPWTSPFGRASHIWARLIEWSG